MSLRKKTLYVISVTIIGLVVILYTPSYLILQKNIENMKEEKVQTSIRYILNNISSEISTLDTVTADWSAWNDSYEFVVDLNKKFIDDNLIDESFRRLKVNLIIFLNNDNKIVFSKVFDLENDKELPLPKGINDLFTTNTELFYFKTVDDSKNGIILTREYPLLLAAHPILTSDKKGPSRGALIMARFLNSQILNRISEEIKAPVTIQRLDTPLSTYAISISLIAQEKDIIVRQTNKQFVSGYTVVRDIFKNPILLLNVDIPHTAFKKQQTFLSQLIFYILIIGVVFGLITLLIIEKLVLSRLFHLSSEVDNIGESSNLSARVSISGKDELANLSAKINKTLDALEESNKVIYEDERKFRESIENVGLIVVGIDAEGKINLFNKEAQFTSDYTAKEVMQKPYLPTFFAPEQIDMINEYMITAADQGFFNQDFECFWITKSGERRTVVWNYIFVKDSNGNNNGIIGFGRDITERKKLEEELFKMRNIDSLGIFAGGIAHDFNNLLMGILGNISVAKMRTIDIPSTSKILGEAEKAILHAKDLTQQLLTFSRGGIPVKKRVSIIELIKESIEFILRGSKVRGEFKFPAHPLHVYIDEGQINQVITNLTVNAVQAMPDGGTISVSCENIIVGRQHILPLSEGHYVKISIKDQGIGISPENLQKIFDPYFTTKADGNGLGLSTAYSIIKHHNGYITAESRLGVGTKFCIYLPAAGKEEIITQPEKAPVEEKIKHIPKKGQGRILVMDDEEIVRNVSGLMLKELGYEAEFAKDGKEAIQIFERAVLSNKPFDAVIMDLTIPGGMGGKECIKILTQIDSNVKAIVSSGYSIDEVLSDYKEYGFSGVVTKPYKLDELNEILYTVLSK